LTILNIFWTGGDPTATGRGGSSIYGKSFDDEIHDDLKHTGSLLKQNDP
jgi:peptidyl-prolyl cis-trans isomerase-like 1